MLGCCWICAAKTLEELKDLVTGAEKCTSGVNSLEPVVADRDASGRFAASVSQALERCRKEERGEKVGQIPLFHQRILGADSEPVLNLKPVISLSIA